MFRKKTTLIILIVIFAVATSIAQDLRGGEISIIQASTVNPFFYVAKVLIHYDSLTLVNRPTLLFNWGDGTIDTLPRLIMQSCALLGSGIMKSVTTAAHTYSNYGSYVVSCIDSFLVPGIININNSGNEKLYLEAYLVINPSFGYSTSPVFHCQPYSWDCHLPWIHNPFAVDPEGDSLTYQLVPWYTSNFTMPLASVDSITGDFRMSPTAVGKYAVGYQVRELRQIPNQSYHIGTVTRLMLIDVPCLTSLNDIEIENGIVVYPNPVSNILTIEMLTYSSEKKYISIYDILGKQVLSESFSSQKHTVNVSELVKGIYVVELRIGKNLVRKKFVKK